MSYPTSNSNLQVHQTTMHPNMPCVTLSQYIKAAFTMAVGCQWKLFHWCSAHCGCISSSENETLEEEQKKYCNRTL